MSLVVPPSCASTSRIVGFVLAVLAVALAGCKSGPGPEADCYEDNECAAPTPTCGVNLCTHDCASTADCADLSMQTSCDTRAGQCQLPCTADQRGSYACVGGDRHYCGEVSGLTCDVCPSMCGSSSFCQGTTCVPRHAVGETCTSGNECMSESCTSAHQCGVGQGEACTAATCDGVCATGTAGGTFCIRPSCPSDCGTRMDGGFRWTCVNYTSYQACVPIENCTWESPCHTFTESTCGMSCQSSGGCWTYCVPNPISTDDH